MKAGKAMVLWGAIPLTLGLAAGVSLGFTMGSHAFSKELSQEERRAIYVGAQHRTKSTLKVVLPNEGPAKVDRVDMDGSVAAVYFHNAGDEECRGIKANAQLVSPDGTLLASQDGYSSLMGGPDKLSPGEKGEVVFEGIYYGIQLDDRASRIRFTLGCR